MCYPVGQGGSPRSRLLVRLGLFVAAMIVGGGPVCAQQAHQAAPPSPRRTLSGFVRDAESGEKLIGVNLYAPVLQVGATTNAHGFYSLTLPAGTVHVVVSYLGFERQELNVELTENRRVDVELSPTTFVMDTVAVVAPRGASVETETQMSRIEVPVAQIRKTPVLLGEVDVLKTLQLLPGAQSGAEGSSGLYVRGGSPDQNLILLDGAPLYNVNHLFGFLSVFNADVVQNVSLVKGGFPARYGGRLSSVVEVDTKDGNLRAYQADGAVGLLTSRLTVQGPLRRNRTSFLVSARRTYADALWRLFMPSDRKGGYYFYDVSAKLNHVFSRSDRVFLSSYAGKDRFYSRYEGGDAVSRFGFDWGNLTSTLRWNHLFGPKLFGNLTLLYSRYRFDIDAEDRSPGGSGERVSRLSYRSSIRDWSLRADLDFVPGPAQYVRFGSQATYHTFRPDAAQLQETLGHEVSEDTLIVPSKVVRALEVRFYVEDDVRLSTQLKANAGVHLSAFSVGGRVYTSLEPRLSLRYLLPGGWAAKASYAAMQQYVHLLTNSSIGLPTDLWVPVTSRVRPQQSQQLAAGVARSLGGGAYELSLEGYYKRMRGLIEYREGAAFSLGLSNDWQDRVVSGRGRSFGFEVFLQRKEGRTTGWIGYTLSRSDRRFDALNGGRTYPYRYDRRHDVSFVVHRRLRPGVDVAATWVYGTGAAVTMPLARYAPPGRTPFDLGSSLGPGEPIDAYGERNGYRMAPYHRLDLGVDFTRPTRHGERVLSLGVYNVYNRRNPFFIYFDTGNDRKRVARQVSLFPVLPSISYRFSF